MDKASRLFEFKPIQVQDDSDWILEFPPQSSLCKLSIQSGWLYGSCNLGICDMACHAWQRRIGCSIYEVSGAYRCDTGQHDGDHDDGDDSIRPETATAASNVRKSLTGCFFWVAFSVADSLLLTPLVWVGSK